VSDGRTGWYAFVLALATALLFVAVGRHPANAAPQTTFAPIGRTDLAVYRAMDDIQTAPLVWLARALGVLGAGIVTVPIRIAVTAWLAARRRWWTVAAWVLTWVCGGIVSVVAREYFHRGRPPNGLVKTYISYSFPSGHAVTAAATALAAVLLLVPPGPRRPAWYAAVATFSLAMAFSRVYLNVHWLSDVVTGLLIGASAAFGSVAVVQGLRVSSASRREGAA
jgi:undecaprenyl-diphosphatase